MCSFRGMTHELEEGLRVAAQGDRQKETGRRRLRRVLVRRQEPVLEGKSASHPYIVFKNGQRKKKNRCDCWHPPGYKRWGVEIGMPAFTCMVGRAGQAAGKHTSIPLQTRPPSANEQSQETSTHVHEASGMRLPQIPAGSQKSTLQ